MIAIKSGDIVRTSSLRPMWSHSNLQNGLSRVIGEFCSNDVALVLINDCENSTLLILANEKVGWIIRCRSVGTIKCATECSQKV